VSFRATTFVCGDCRHAPWKRVDSTTDVLQLSNTSPFAARIFGLPDQEGVDTMYVVVKATFRLVSGGVVIEEDEPKPVVLADEYWGEPGESSLKYASEVHLLKQGTDVMVVGQACAPGDKPVTHVDVSVGIADRMKHARVQGDRYWTEGLGGMRPSKPKPFVRMPVVYERAYGGRHVLDVEKGTLVEEPRNPVGCGFLGKRSGKQLLGHPVPSVEDLQRPIGLLGERSVPVGFGAIAPWWEPRRSRVGTYDEAWKETQAPYLPRDFDARFFNVATEELVVPRGLVGGEAVAVLGFHPQGMLRFDLPRCELAITATVAGQRVGLLAKIETVVLEPTDQRFAMSWRAALPVDKKMLQVETIEVALQKIEGLMGARMSA
jgi:hypothetical protein